MRRIEFIVVHTAGAYDAKRKRVVHQSFEVVRNFHMMPLPRYDAANKLVPGTGGRGFKEMGYEIYITVDGKMHAGRPESWPTGGAHTKKLNHISYGICCSGHGDFEPFNDLQLAAVVAKASSWCRLNALAPVRVLGHNETPRFGGVLPEGKTCPGKFVDMDMIRGRVRDALAGVPIGSGPPLPLPPPDGKPPAPITRPFNSPPTRPKV